MGIFKKKIKVNLDDILSTPVPLIRGLREDCPPMMRVSKLCVCSDCPRRSKCQVEEVAKFTGTDEKGLCRRFVRACSVRTRDLSGDPKCADYIVEELKDYLDRKYIYGGV